MIKILLNLNHFGEHDLPHQNLFKIEWDGSTADQYYSLLGNGYEEAQSHEWYMELFKTFSAKMKEEGFEINPDDEDLFECATYLTTSFETEAKAMYWLHGFYERAQSVVVAASGSDDYSDYAPDYVNAFIQASKQIDKGELAKTFLHWMQEEESDFFTDNFFDEGLRALDPPTKESFIREIQDFIMGHPYMRGRNHENWDPSEGTDGEMVEVNIVAMNDDGTTTGILVTNTKPE